MSDPFTLEANKPSSTIARALVERWAYNETGWRRADRSPAPAPLGYDERARLFVWVLYRLPAWPYDAAERESAVDDISLTLFRTGRRDVDYLRASMLCEAAAAFTGDDASAPSKREQARALVVERGMDTPDSDALLVPIPGCNDVLHAASILGVTVRRPRSAGGEFAIPGVIITHGADEQIFRKSVDCETLAKAESVCHELVRAWRVGLRAHAQMLALAAEASNT